MEDRFVTNQTFRTTGNKSQTHHRDFDKPFIDTLISSGIKSFDIDKTKTILSRFRSDFAISLNKTPNRDIKEKWVNYWKHEY